MEFNWGIEKIQKCVKILNLQAWLGSWWLKLKTKLSVAPFPQGLSHLKPLNTTILFLFPLSTIHCMKVLCMSLDYAETFFMTLTHRLPRLLFEQRIWDNLDLKYLICNRMTLELCNSPSFNQQNKLQNKIIFQTYFESNSGYGPIK